MTDPGALTERQKKWFDAVHDGLERDTGRTLAQWTALAMACPETAHRKRLAWMKETYGLGQNRASLVLNAAFPPDAGWANPAPLADALWANAAARAILDAVTAAATSLPGLVVGQRKTFTAFSRTFQFAALKPAKTGALLGLALPPEAAPGLEAARRESWSDRLLSKMTLADADSVTPLVAGLVRSAWERS